MKTDKGDKANQPTGESIERLKLRAIVRWLEANQPDVFKRGLWEAISEAETLDKPVSVKQAPLSPTEECWNCGSLVWAKAEAPRKPSAEQELLNKYRMAIDAIYNSGDDLGRNLVIKHFGLHHPTVEIESFGDPWGGPDSHGNEPTVREVRQHPEPAPTEPKCAKPGCGDAYGAPSHNPHNWMYHEFVKGEHPEPASDLRSWNGKELRHLTRACADGNHNHCGGVAKFANADNTDDCRTCNCACHGEHPEAAPKEKS